MSPAPDYTSCPQAAEIVASQWQPGDGIVYAQRSGQHLVDLAFEKDLPASVRLDDVFAGRSALQEDSLWAWEYPGLPTPPLRTTRLWLVSPGPQDDVPVGGCPAKRDM